MPVNNFDSSIRFASRIGEILFTNTSKNDESLLSSKYNIDLYRSINAYLYLYRFPALLINKNEGLKFIFFLKIRVIYGIFRFLLFTKKLTITKVFEQLQSTSSSILFFGVNNNFYSRVLHPVSQLLSYKKQNVFQLNLAKEKRFFNTFFNIEEIVSNFNLKIKILLQARNFYSNIDWFRINQILFKEGFLYDVNILKDEIKWCIFAEIPRLKYKVNSLDKELLKLNIDLFISADDCDQTVRVVNLLAKSIGIKTLVIQQGITTKNYPDWNDVTAQHIACMSHPMAEIMMYQGVSKDVIRVVGNPCFDNYINKYIKTSCSETYLVDNKIFLRKNILFASQPYVHGAFATREKRNEMINIFLKASDELCNYNFIFKMHPVEKKSEITKLLSKYSNIILVEPDSDLTKLIRDCDIFVTMFSQTTLDAIIFQKTVINIHTHDCGCTEIFSSSDATFVARNKSQFVDLIKQVSRDDWSISDQMLKAREIIIEKLIYKADGKSAERVCDYIYELL